MVDRRLWIAVQVEIIYLEKKFSTTISIMISLMFKSLVVLKLEEHKQIILYLHSEIGHFGGRILVEMNKRYFLAQQDGECESCSTCMQTMLDV
jgi:hypothetical protein